MSAQASSKKVIYAALVGNLLIAITKLFAAAWTGSSAMLSEGVHSLVDTGNELLLLYGLHRAAKPADAEHPLGYGRELYFWSFIVALLIFSIGAGVSLYEGIAHILNPVAISDARINYIVLGISLVFEGGSWFVAFREFRKIAPNLGYLEAATRSKDPTSFMVLFEDSAALIGILIALAGTFIAEQFEAPVFDGVASVGIALLLAATGAYLARESKGLLMGEPATKATRETILRIAREHPDILSADELLTTHLAPQQIVVALTLDFVDHSTAVDIERDFAGLEASIKRSCPDVVAFFIKPRLQAAGPSGDSG
ncbi:MULTISPECIES: cation diffusion facilitator family transporter [Rhodopseudomonas]|uniref:cation diffusion facilitator family transporter n=1 Tax=Rhodopseudomonas TaxID=1073 RepID=UPI0005C86D79|nr:MULTISPECIES: cation diffusion facilitator family transporter [Rhodopseudomonas]MDF3810664.1 cation diffusion facilitator family transporter [Rhodopseudomonas sp. BAL398]WOK18457.1 cation diffusion facilitator family transporter [Rhodopseudomonas sp. BAL398]